MHKTKYSMMCTSFATNKARPKIYLRRYSGMCRCFQHVLQGKLNIARRLITLMR